MLNSERSLFLTSPFYIDRKYRPHLTPQPRCLCLKLNVRTPVNSLETSINYITNCHKKSCKYYMRSQQLSPMIKVDHTKERIQWDEKNTLIFKQKLEKLLNQKKIAYLHIKQEQINNKNERDLNKLKVQQSNHKKVESIKAHKRKNLKLIQYFTKQFIEKQNIGDQKKVSKQTIEKGILKFLQHKRYMNSHLFKTYSYGQQNKTISSFKLGKQEQSTSKIQDFKKFMNKLKNCNGINSSEYIRKNNAVLEEIPRNMNQLSQKSFQKHSKSGQGTQKFYKIIKQLLVKSKQEKVKEEFSTKRSSRNDIQIKSFQRNKNNVTNEKKHENDKNQSKLYCENVADLTLEQIKEKQKLEIKVQKKQNKIGKLNQPKLKSKQSLNSIKKKKPNKISVTKIQNKKQKKDNVSISRLRQLLVEQIVQENTSKSKNKTHKTGLNYAKLYGKIFKAAQSQKQTLSPQKLRYLKKINTRQAYLKRKNRFTFEDVEKSIENSQNQHSQQKSPQIQIVQSSNQSDSSSSSFHNLHEPKLRLTKYEEARLMYNMRNIKCREMISTMKNTAQQKDFLKIPMPSLCNLNDIEIFQENQRKKQGSIVRNADNYEQQVINQNQIGMENKILYSSKNMVTNKKVQLVDLTNFQQFDLGQVKKNIVLYLKKYMKNNQKARQLYNFLIFMEESRKIALQQQEINSSLDQLQTQKQQTQIKNIISMLDLKIDDYQSCNIIQKSSNWNEKDLLTNKSFIDKLDSRSIELIYYNNQPNQKFMDTLCQRSLQQFKNLPI